MESVAPPFLQPSRNDALRPWVTRATKLIADRVADARSHGEAGRTAEASARLDELQIGLVGTSNGGGLLADARASFYRQAFHETPYDPRIHSGVIGPDGPGELAARFATIGGRNQYVDIVKSIGNVSMALRALSDAARAAGNGPDDFWPTAFQSWQNEATQTLTLRAHGAFSDAQMALSEAVGIVRIKPALR